MRGLRPFNFAAVCIIPVLAACGGRGGGAARSLPVLPSAGPASPAISVSLVVPARTSSTGNRKPHFVSSSTLGAKLTVSSAAGASTFAVDLSQSSSACTAQGAQRVCAISLTAAVGSDTFSISTYDQAPQNGAIPASAHLLGTGSVTQTITAGFSGSLTMYVDAAVNGYGSLPVFSSLPADGAPHAYLFILNPTDFDNNPIVNGSSDPYMNPIAAALTETGGSGHAHLVLNGTASGAGATMNSSHDSIAVQYDGSGPPGYSISVAFSAAGVSPMTTMLSPLYVTSTSGAFSNFALQLSGASTSVPFTVQEANAPPGTAFTASAPTCTNIASVSALVQSGAAAAFSVAGGSAGGSCAITVADGTSTVTVSVTNTLPATPTPSPTPTPTPTVTSTPTQTPTPTPTPTPTATPVPTWTTVPLGPSVYVSNGGVGEMVTYAQTGWSPNNSSWPYNTNLTPTSKLFYHDYQAGGLICYDNVHKYVWAIDSSNAMVQAYPANASGTDVPAVATLQLGTLSGYPTGCAVDASGNVYVTAYGAIFSGIADMVAIYPSGSTTAGTVIRGTNAGLNIPRKLTVDAGGNIYVADSTGKDIRVFASPGMNAGIIDVAPTRIISYAFTNPWGVAVDGAGHVYVADTYGIAGYVEVFPAGTTNAAASAPIFTIGSGNQIPSSPNGLAFDSSGNLWVACTDSIQVFDAASLAGAIGSAVAPNPYASIWGTNTLISGATGIGAQ